jgi:hypothetical protein
LSGRQAGEAQQVRQVGAVEGDCTKPLRALTLKFYYA